MRCRVTRSAFKEVVSEIYMLEHLHLSDKSTCLKVDGP